MNPSKLPGIALCLVIALPSWFLGKTFPIIGGPIISILLGMVAGQFLKDRTKVKSGISYIQIHPADGCGLFGFWPESLCHPRNRLAEPSYHHLHHCNVAYHRLRTAKGHEH